MEWARTLVSLCAVQIFLVRWAAFLNGGVESDGGNGWWTHILLHFHPSVGRNQNKLWPFKSQICCCLVTKSCWTLCDPMECSIGFPVLHHLTPFAATHVHWLGDATPPSHPLSSSSPAFNFSQHQGLFQWVSYSFIWDSKIYFGEGTMS